MDALDPDRARNPVIEDTDLHAYNGAFWDLGFKWQWDAGTYRELAGIASEKERIRAYLETHQPHLLRAYAPEFLVNLIHENKARRKHAIITSRDSGEPLNLTCNGVNGAN